MKRKLVTIIIILSVLLISCNLEKKSDILHEWTSKRQGKLVMYVVGADNEFAYKVNQVHNANPTLLKLLDNMTIHTTKTEINKWKKLGIEQIPSVVILDEKTIVFSSNDPEQLNQFAEKYR